MRARYLSIFAAVCGLAGCVEETADPGKYMWARPGATHQQFQSDTDECRRKASIRPYSTATDAVSYRAGNQRAYMDCMYERGWKYETSAGPDRMDEMVTCRLPSAPKAEVMKARDCHNRYGTILTM